LFKTVCQNLKLKYLRKVSITMNNILDDVKKFIGIQPDYDIYDLDITMNINSVLSILQQIGLCTSLVDNSIEGSTSVWSDITDDNILLNLVKNYVYLKVRSMFDPPSSSATANAISATLKELEWRILNYDLISSDISIKEEEV